MKFQLYQAILSPSAYFPATGNHQSTFCLLDLTNSDTSYEWNCATHDLLCGTSLLSIIFHFINVMHVSGLSLFMVKSFIDWFCHILFNYSFVDSHLGCFHFYRIVDCAFRNICACVFVQSLGFLSFVDLSRSKIVGSYNNSKLNFLRKGQTIFHSNGTILHFHHQSTSMSVSF